MTREAQVWRFSRSEVWPEAVGKAESWAGRGLTKRESVFCPSGPQQDCVQFPESSGQ